MADAYLVASAGRTGVEEVDVFDRSIDPVAVVRRVKPAEALGLEVRSVNRSLNPYESRLFRLMRLLVVLGERG